MLNVTSPENNIQRNGYHNNSDTHPYDRRGRSSALFPRRNHHASGGGPPGRALLQRIQAHTEGVNAYAASKHPVGMREAGSGVPAADESWTARRKGLKPDALRPSVTPMAPIMNCEKSESDERCLHTLTQSSGTVG